MVGSVINECVIGSVIQNYGNLKAILSTTIRVSERDERIQKLGYEATVKELDKNRISRNVIDMFL